MFHNYILELLTNMLKQTTTVEHNFPISTCWRLSLLYDHLLTKLNDVCLYVEGFGVSTRQASAPSDCLCSLWRPTTFNRHQFRQERQNHHVWVFSYCKYFLSYAFVGCPPCQHWHSKKRGGLRQIYTEVVRLIQYIRDCWRLLVRLRDFQSAKTLYICLHEDYTVKEIGRCNRLVQMIDLRWS